MATDVTAGLICVPTCIPVSDLYVYFLIHACVCVPVCCVFKCVLTRQMSSEI